MCDGSQLLRYPLSTSPTISSNTLRGRLRENTRDFCLKSESTQQGIRQLYTIAWIFILTTTTNNNLEHLVPSHVFCA